MSLEFVAGPYKIGPSSGPGRCDRCGGEIRAGEQIITNRLSRRRACSRCGDNILGRAVALIEAGFVHSTMPEPGGGCFQCRRPIAAGEKIFYDPGGRINCLACSGRMSTGLAAEIGGRPS